MPQDNSMLIYTLYAMTAIVAILAFVAVFLYLKIVKQRVQAEIAREEFAKELERQQQQYTELGVNTYKASASSRNKPQA